MPVASSLPLQGTDAITDHVTCLGCGCACDDVRVVVRGGRIASTERACELGAHWFGDGGVPTQVRMEGRDAEWEHAIERSATTLSRSEHVLVYLADDLSCEAQRVACAIADRLHGTLESASSSTAAAGILAAQARGRTTATLSEIRHRADVVAFWGVDPATRYPRFIERYLPVENRTVIAVDIGPDRGPANADVRFAFDIAQEVTAQSLTCSAVKGHGDMTPLAKRLMAGRYVALITDGEPHPGRDPGRAEGMIVLAEALNASTRCALITLRAGGNRGGAEAVMTWQTGYPMSVDFARGYPQYAPEGGGATDVTVALIVGSWQTMPAAAREALSDVPCIIVGPHASARTPPATVAIDTGVAGIHEGGMAFRMDDIPLPLTPTIAGVRSTVDTLHAVLHAIARALGR